ncbi:hypothetical protein GC105_15890 [Alkalibaculum sp. M08DMB]|uniref:MOSC domain-containing protein n=1 Tax=Alkalibaculum sporogenes TaxID=2655001 RepID=A0A6A7KCJ3_9FIRM|nr:hypothetical protein [Alkalibaculum sporogenes]MPW27249.1 hypothetical protein [Alkalibaculum sporogenes]
MSQLMTIRVKQSRGESAVIVEEAVLEAGLGIRGDVFSGKDKQISMMDGDAKFYMASDREDGFCISKFSENITTTGINFEVLSKHSKLSIGDTTILQIIQKGKECHVQCPVYNREGNCGLANKVAYAKVITSGNVKNGDKIRVYECI